jgi:acetyl esterase/lipase
LFCFTEGYALFFFQSTTFGYTPYRIDENRIGVLGYSSGGNLALMLGLTDCLDGLEGDCGDSRVTSRVQAVVNLAGPTEWEMHHSFYSVFCEAFLGGTPEETPARYKAASPLIYVTPDDPPILTVCGTKDVVLPEEKILDDRMKAVNAFHELIIIEGAGHSMSDLMDFYQDNPVWDFLDKHLKE